MFQETLKFLDADDALERDIFCLLDQIGIEGAKIFVRQGDHAINPTDGRQFLKDLDEWRVFFMTWVIVENIFDDLGSTPYSFVT